MLPERPIYCDAERAILAVLHHENNSAAEAGIADCGGGDQYLSHERWIVWLEFKPWRHGTEEWRCYQQSPEQQEHSAEQSQGWCLTPLRQKRTVSPDAMQASSQNLPIPVQRRGKVGRVLSITVTHRGQENPT